MTTYGIIRKGHTIQLTLVVFKIKECIFIKRIFINHEIKAQSVRLIGANGEQVGVVPFKEAMQKAEEANLDLVQIGSGDPVICKIIDAGKYLYELKRKEKENRKNQTVIVVKEIRMSPGIDQNDLTTKMKQTEKFLQSGHKVKVSVRFKGRQITHPEIGRKLLEQVQTELGELAATDQKPKMDGRSLTMLLSPKKV